MFTQNFMQIHQVDVKISQENGNFDLLLELHEKPGTSPVIMIHTVGTKRNLVLNFVGVHPIVAEIFHSRAKL